MARTGPDPRNISCWVHSLKFPSLGKGGPDRPGPTQARTTEHPDSRAGQPPNRPGQARTKVRARFNPRLEQSIFVLAANSLLRVFVLGIHSSGFTP